MKVFYQLMENTSSIDSDVDAIMQKLRQTRAAWEEHNRLREELKNILAERLRLNAGEKTSFERYGVRVTYSVNMQAKYNIPKEIRELYKTEEPISRLTITFNEGGES